MMFLQKPSNLFVVPPSGGTPAEDRLKAELRTKAAALLASIACCCWLALAASAGGAEPAAPCPTLLNETPIDLATVLQLTGANNPTIGVAAEAVAASQADLMQARALLLPTLDAGTNFNLHRGNLQNSAGIVRGVDRQAMYAGFGAYAVGSGTVTIPGIRLVASLADALFQPRAARYEVAAREFDATATRNDILLAATLAYFDLLGAEARLAALRQSQAEFNEVARLTAEHARAGQGRQSDADRARSQALLVETQQQQAVEDIAVAAAELARLLSMDPSVCLRAGVQIPLVELVDLRDCLDILLGIALRNRPEIGARSAEVAISETILRQEKYRPFLPVLVVGYSAGTFGGGNNIPRTDHFGRFNDRTDFDVLAVWSLRNLGMGNLAEQRNQRAQVRQAEAERLLAINLVRRQVAEAQADALARRAEVTIATRQLQTAEQGYRLDLTRIKNLEGRPIEVTNSATLLLNARLELIQALIAYDQAQFRLFVALGQPPVVPPPAVD